MTVSISNIGHQVSAFADSILYARTKTAARIRVGAMFMLTGALIVYSSTGIAEASNLKDYNAKVVNKTNNITDVINYVAYIGGAALAALGIVDLKKHVENPSQTPMKNGIAKLGFGGMLLALPALAGMVQGTTGEGSNVTAVPFTPAPNVP